MVGGLLAFGLACLVEYLDDTFKSPEEVQAVLGLSALGMTPETESKGDTDLVTLACLQSSTAEAYRVLRTNLQFAEVSEPVRTLLVTSPSPFEGKTTTAANLAVSLAQAGKRVVLVDADLHRPRLHRIFKLQNHTGVSGALLDSNSQDSILLQPASVPGLRVLTSGPLPPNPAELLGAPGMQKILDKLAADADLVILDSPPLLALSDAAVLAAQVDGVLLVVDSKRTRRPMATMAVENLQHVQARVVGVVLNRRATPGCSSYYYHYSHTHHFASRSAGCYESSRGLQHPRQLLLAWQGWRRTDTRDDAGC
jgi:non-specific protein-tyrosine kinase